VHEGAMPGMRRARTWAIAEHSSGVRAASRMHRLPRDAAVLYGVHDESWRTISGA
jgi:hypothetical protein